MKKSAKLFLFFCLQFCLLSGFAQQNHQKVICSGENYEQFDFWEDNEQMTSHVWDPDEEDTDENPINDPEDARYIGYWHDQDNIEHFNGADVGNARLEVQEVDSNEWPNKPIGDAIINDLD